MLAFQLANLYQAVVICIIILYMQMGKNVFRDIKILMDWSFVLKSVIKGSECHILNPNHLFLYPIQKILPTNCRYCKFIE